MEASWCRAVAGGVRLALQVTPNARKTALVGVVDGVLKLKLQAQPVEGKANAALLKWLAQTLGVARGAVVLSHGASSRNKLVDIRGLDCAAVARLLAP